MWPGLRLSKAGEGCARSMLCGSTGQLSSDAVFVGLRRFGKENSKKGVGVGGKAWVDNDRIKLQQSNKQLPPPCLALFPKFPCC